MMKKGSKNLPDLLFLSSRGEFKISSSPKTIILDHRNDGAILMLNNRKKCCQQQLPPKKRKTVLTVVVIIITMQWINQIESFRIRNWEVMSFGSLSDRLNMWSLLWLTKGRCFYHEHIHTYVIIYHRFICEVNWVGFFFQFYYLHSLLLFNKILQ